jgi:hypothetical protein
MGCVWEVDGGASGPLHTVWQHQRCLGWCGPVVGALARKSDAAGALFRLLRGHRPTLAPRIGRLDASKSVSIVHHGLRK